MDKRRSINTKIWSDEWVESLDPAEKLMWLYLLTNPQTNMLGIYPITIKRISFDTGLAESVIDVGLAAFSRSGKAYYWAGYVVLTNWIKNQSMNPNMEKAAIALYSELPSSIAGKLKEVGVESFQRLSKGSKAFGTLRKREKEIEKESEVESECLSPDGETEKIIVGSLSLKDRKQPFLDEVARYKEQYSSESLQNFIGYWTEADNTGKMRFENEKHWELKLRLRRWKDDKRK